MGLAGVARHAVGRARAFVLVGALSHSGRFRAMLCEQTTFGHLAEAIHTILACLGGTPRVWRTDRMATIVVPGTDRLTVDTANIAKHYGVEIAVCPPRAGAAQGCGREGRAVPDAVVVADRARRLAGRRAGQSGQLERRGLRPALTAGRHGR